MPEVSSAPERNTIFPGEFEVTKKSKRKSLGFKDAPYWDNLANKYLEGHRLPNWGVLLATDVFSTEWLPRTGVSESMFYNVLGCSVEEFIKMNKKWPLRAFIGVLLEIRDMKSNKIPKVG